MKYIHLLTMCIIISHAAQLNGMDHQKKTSWADRVEEHERSQKPASYKAALTKKQTTHTTPANQLEYRSSRTVTQGSKKNWLILGPAKKDTPTQQTAVQQSTANNESDTSALIEEDNKGQQALLKKLTVLADTLQKVVTQQADQEMINGNLTKQLQRQQETHHDQLQTMAIHYSQEMLAQQQTHAKAMQTKQEELNKMAEGAIKENAQLQQKYNLMLSLISQQQALHDQKLDQLTALLSSLVTPIQQEWQQDTNNL